MAKRLPSPHDTLFKDILFNLDAAASFFEKYLPKKIKRNKSAESTKPD